MQHISPNTFEKMREKFATQIFSRTVAAAIKTIYETTKFLRIGFVYSSVCGKNRQNFRLT